MGRLRVGQGFDVHRFGGAGPLVLCGVRLEDESGLVGHSDADVALHAVCDALFGAAGAGDIGEHFPDHEEQWRDVSSTVFVDHAVKIVKRAGFRPVNCDLTIVGERPRVAAHRSAMRASLAELLDLELGRISVKATTTDGLGFIGRAEGLAAMAIVLVEEVGDRG
jgi:2-C-methyl-D-erythritol 2,4-cyclodiphosphate synthase